MMTQTFYWSRTFSPFGKPLHFQCRVSFSYLQIGKGTKRRENPSDRWVCDLVGKERLHSTTQATIPTAFKNLVFCLG